MTPCECTGPGYCPRRNTVVTSTGHRLCKNGRPEQVAAYFEKTPRVERAAVAARKELGCAYLGPAVRDEAGTQVKRACPSCRGTVMLKVFECGHPGHAGDPTTTAKECGRCSDYVVALVEIGPALPDVSAVGSNAEMNHWRGG